MKMRDKKPYNVLIVDDEESIVNFLAAAMEDEGFRVTSATKPQEALEIFSSQKPDVVLLDLRMPGMSGVEAVKRMRESDPGKEAVIIIITAYASDLSAEDRALLKKLDVREIIPKSVSLFEAKERILRLFFARGKEK
jgi:CheY-like chemotaxis protein